MTELTENLATMVENKKIINDFCITFSTINGSGSATANTTLMRALFKMGIPVSGKNHFPVQHPGATHLVFAAGERQGIFRKSGEG